MHQLIAIVQIERIEDMTGAIEPKTNFTLVVLQTELERFKFVIRSFLRARISKVGVQAGIPRSSAHIDGMQIDKYPLHYRQLLTSDPALLSPLEQQYLTSHQALLSSHYHSSFLSSFPSNLQKLDDTTGGVSMVDRPDEDAAVFARVLRDAGYVAIYGQTETGDVELKRGDIWVLRWSAIKAALLRGDVELL